MSSRKTWPMDRPPYHWKLSTFLDFKTWQSRTLSSYKMILKDTSIPMLITTLFTIAKTWKQPKCPLTEEWIKQLWSIYTMDSYSAITKNEIMPFAAIYMDLEIVTEKAMATHSSTLAWKIPQTEKPGRLQSMGSWRVRHDWVTSLSLFTFMHWRRKWQPTPVFLPGDSQGRGSLVGCRLWGHTESDTTEVT